MYMDGCMRNASKSAGDWPKAENEKYRGVIGYRVVYR